MNKTRMGKRAASLLLSLVMMLSLLPTAAYAAMADGVDTQGAIVSENGTGVSDDSNSSGNTDDLQVEDSKDSGNTGDQQVGGSSGSGTADDPADAEGGADPTDSVNGNDSADPQDGDGAVTPAATNVVSTSEELVAAIAAASDGDTITLGEGEFTTYGNTSPKKSLTFEGVGTNTVWTIGDLNQDAKGEGNGDCSFEGCETITFKNMTLKVDNKNYRGFIRINNTVVENCTLEGRTAYWGYETAKFVNATFNAPEGDYALWDYSTKAMTFEGCTFNISGKGVNVYVEAANADKDVTRTVAVNNCTVNSSAEGKAFLNIKNSTQSYDVTLSGRNTVTGLAKDSTTGSELYQVETTEVTETTGNPVTVKQENTAGEFETIYEVKKTEKAYVAEVGSNKYETLQAAIDAAAKNATVILLADTRENVTINTYGLTLDLNGHTLNGGTVAGKPALTVTARVTVKDSSAAQTGTIMREDTAENSGVSSHYVIDIQDGWLFFESGSVTNNSGVVGVKGASLVRVGDYSVAKYPGLTISGGTFTQDNFIVIKVDRGTFYLKEDGTLNSKNSYAVENWKSATIKGGTVNGTVAAWTYSGGHNSDLTISGGTVNGNVLSVNYGSAEGKVAKVSITGGTVNGALDTRSYDPSTNELTSIDDATKATIAVTGGTFSSDPTKYVVEDSAINKNDDGTFGVAKAYLAKVGDTSYYTMDEAFKAQTASGKDIVLLRDYTTGSAFPSGSIDRTVDLNGHTWTCTGTDANSAAFEINYSDVTLTVKNGKVVSSQLVGLIPSAMGGTIKYDNSSLVFDGVEMTTTARSGIETNGNNTNDPVTLRNSTLNVPNGYGIYFPSSGTLTIDNSVINAQTMGVQVCSGSLNISGAGTAITVSGDGIDKTINDGAIEDGAAISIVNRTGYKGLSNIEVKGGTFTAKDGNAAVKAYNWKDLTESDFTQAAKVSVSGGTFSSEVDKSLCAGGYIPTQNADGTYSVKEGADGYVEDENGNVIISTAEGLFYFAKKVNAGNNFAGKTVTLANNIDLNNEKWTPIGIFNDATTQFKGTFDGQNHAVTGLKVEESRKNGVGFFGKVYTGTIKNLTVEGSVSTSNCTYVGGIVGHGYATITNCTFKGSVGSTDTMQVGGIAGSGGFTVTDCSVYADVTAECWAGGIVGNCQDGGAYTNCYVDGVISAEYTYWGGGAAGITPVPLYPSQVISGCYSNTVVKVAGKEVNCPIIATYNNPLDYNGYSGGLKIYDNSWNKQKNSNDSYPIYAEKDGKGGVLMEGMTAARDNSLIMLADDLNYVTGDLSKVRIMAGSSVTQAQIDALAVASVGDSKYQSLAEAIDAAQDGQTVRLLADAEQNAQLTIDKSITLDLNGKTIRNTVDIWGDTANAILSIKNGAKVTITGNGTIDAKENDCYTINVAKGDLTIENGTFYGNVSVVQVEEGTLSVKGGTFDLHQKWEGSSKYLFNCIDSEFTSGNAKVAISGGTFVGFDPNVSPEQKVDGKTPSFAAPGVGITKNENGSFTAAAGMTAQILDKDGNSVKAYNTLADAVAAAQDGQTVKLLADVAESSIKVNANITIDLNKMTVTGSFVTYGEVTIQNGTIDVPDGKTNYAYGKLTLADVDITGKAASSSLLSVNYNGSVTIDKDSTIVADSEQLHYPAVFIKGQDDSGKTYAPELNIYGTVQSAKTPAIQGNGTDRGVSHVNVFEGAVVKSETLAIYLPQPCEVNITGGLVEGYCGIGIKSGTLNISGGTVRGVANDNVIGDEYSQTNGISYDGSAIMIDSYIGYAGQVQINISGNAVVESKYSTAIREIGNDKSQTNLVGLDITGGTVLGAKDTDAVLVRDVTAKDVNISGGEFSSIVKKEYCAPGFTPVTTANSEGRYGVEVGKFTVMVTSRTTGSNSPVANVTGGGSDITYAQGTKVTASAISGYNFVGWFVNEYTGTPYSTDLTCEVKPTADCTMIAVYEPISGGKFWLTVTASEFTVNGGAVQDSYLYEQFAIGTSVTVEFTGTENFLYWVNASNKVVSTDKSYTFVMGSETTLKAVYGKARQNQATVVFISHSDQIISSKAYTTNDTIQFPVPPIKMGCTFTGWSMTEAEIRAAMANNSGIIQVRALYTEPSIACKVTVIYPDGIGNDVVNAVVGKAVNVTAKDIEGKTFSYWTDNAGNVLGYTKTLKLAPSGDMTVKAVYDEAAEVKPVISMTAIDASAGDGYWVISFTATRAVPEGYELVKQGILYSIDSRCAGDACKDYLKLTADGTVPEGVYEFIGSSGELNGVTRFNGGVRTADTTLYGRGYMILKNSAGEVMYVYADTILSGSYNSLNK